MCELAVIVLSFWFQLRISFSFPLSFLQCPYHSDRMTAQKTMSSFIEYIFKVMIKSL